MDTELMQAEESSQSMTAAAVGLQVQLIQEVMKSHMREGEHYGTIPGCGDKKCLLKSGAEKLSMLFKMAPRFKVETIDMGNGHREYRTITEMYHIITGRFLGEGVGSCSTMESKYRYRNGSRKCPACAGEFIIKGKEEYGGGWLCYAKKGGCGAKFGTDAPEIIGQVVGKVENPDIADQYNTVLKISKKRSQVDCTLTVTAASDIFTQDLEENMDKPPVAQTKKPEEQPAPDFPDGVDERPLDDDSPEIIEPEIVNRGKPDPIKEPQPTTHGVRPSVKSVFTAKFDAAKCPTCHLQVQKGDKIYKNAAGKFVHERC